MGTAPGNAANGVLQRPAIESRVGWRQRTQGPRGDLSAARARSNFPSDAVLNVKDVITSVHIALSGRWRRLFRMELSRNIPGQHLCRHHGGESRASETLAKQRLAVSAGLEAPAK